MRKYLGGGSRRTAHVVDAAGFFAGYHLGVDKVFTVPEVIDEVRDEHSKLMLKYSIEAGKVIVVDPEDKYVVHVSRIAKELGELSSLSKTDLKLLALAYKLVSEGNEVYVISDDKSVQNVALKLGAKVIGIKWRVLRRPRKYIYECPICGFRSEDRGVCPRCGVELVKKRTGAGGGI